MVRAYFPQQFESTLNTNSTNSPQGGQSPVISVGEQLLAIYPPIIDTSFTNFKFYQVNNGEFPIPQTDFIWRISDDVGSGIFVQASGFDIRPFLNNERVIEQAVSTGNTFDPEFTINAMQLSDDELHLFVWENGGAINEWILSAPGVFPTTGTPPDFQFAPSETNGRDIKFFDDGNKMAIIGGNQDTIEIYSLPTPNSFSTTPILLQSFNVNFIDNGPASCEFSSDGLKLYVVGGINDRINQWNLTEPFILPAAATPPDRVFPYDPDVTFSNGNMRMFPDGSAFYLVSIEPQDLLCRYDLTDAFNIPTVLTEPDATVDIGGLDTNPRAMSVSKDGSLIRFAGRISGLVHELLVPGKLLEYNVVALNFFTGVFTIDVKVPTIQDLTFIQLVIGNPAAVDGSTPLAAGVELSILETPLLTKAEDNFLVDELGRNIVAVQT